MTTIEASQPESYAVFSEKNYPAWWAYCIQKGLNATIESTFLTKNSLDPELLHDNCYGHKATSDYISQSGAWAIVQLLPNSKLCHQYCGPAVTTLCQHRHLLGIATPQGFFPCFKALQSQEDVEKMVQIYRLLDRRLQYICSFDSSNAIILPHIKEKEALFTTTAYLINKIFPGYIDAAQQERMQLVKEYPVQSMDIYGQKVSPQDNPKIKESQDLYGMWQKIQQEPYIQKEKEVVVQFIIPFIKNGFITNFEQQTEGDLAINDKWAQIQPKY